MSKICYVERKFSAERMAIVDQANAICANYQAQGFNLTLRQLYYQFVARDLIPNRQTEYKRLGDIINDARLAGLIDWNYIIDRTRNLAATSHWSGPGAIIESAAYSHRIDKWARQPRRVEVWIEKDALAGVIEPTCQANDVAYFSCRGYTSQSEMWAASQRLANYQRFGQTPTILHLGDHDPSGQDMTRDIRDRLATFGVHLMVDRLALNMNQIEQYSPPPNPTKLTDSRATGYVELYGDESWELDALEPSVLAALIESNIHRLRDDQLWVAAMADEQRQRDLLQACSDQWDDVAYRLENPDE